MIYMFLSNNPSSGNINSLNLSWFFLLLSVKNLIPVVTVPFLTASLLGSLFSDMVRVVDSHAGDLGSNPGRPIIFSHWNYFIHFV